MAARPFSGYWIVAAGAVLIIGRLGYLYYHTARRTANFTAMAVRLGWDQPKDSAAEISGSWRGKKVRFTEFVTGGKNKIRWVDVAVAVDSKGFSFSLRPESLGWKLLELVGLREVKVGDAEFDRRWHIDANRPEGLIALLLPEVRDKINRAEDAGRRGEYRLENGWILYRQRGSYFSNSVGSRMEGQLPLLCDLADGIEVVAEKGGPA